MERNVNKGLTLLLLHLSGVALAKTPTGAVEGLFSISSTKQVYFSQGNLIHEDNTWSFAEHQYDKGLFFGWGTSGYGNPDTISGGKGFHFASIGGTSRNANFDWFTELLKAHFGVWGMTGLLLLLCLIVGICMIILF